MHIKALALLIILAFFPQTGFAERNDAVKRSPEFEVPSILAPRVHFWVDVFSKYGKYQIVVHHRHFPQIIFKVLDFSQAAKSLDPISLDSLKRRVEKERVAEIEGYLENLVRSKGEPSNEMERHIVDQLKGIPGGVSKYKQLLDDELVRTQTGIKEKFGDAIRRTGRYLDRMEEIFTKEYGLPVELTRLPFVESSFDYTAYSSVGAAGIWQFMRGTAKKYMTVNNFIDERLDPVIATRAAAQYLRGAYNSLGTWPMAITSYNHGVAGVYKKMKAQGTTNLAKVIEKHDERVFGFASSNFYPEFLAALDVYDNFRTYFPGLSRDPELRFEDYPISRPVFLNQVAKTLKVEEGELRAVNYALLHPVTSNKRPITAGYTLRVPVSGVTDEQVKQSAVKRVPEKYTYKGAAPVSIGSATTYVVKKGDTIGGIASKFGTTVAALIRDNGLKGQVVKVGQKLKIQKAVATKKTTTSKTVKKAAPVPKKKKGSK